MTRKKYIEYWIRCKHCMKGFPKEEVSFLFNRGIYLCHDCLTLLNLKREHKPIGLLDFIGGFGDA
jgi:rRNA maturation endonuclease Nob1